MNLLDRVFGTAEGYRCLTIFTRDGRHIDRWFKSTDDLLITAQAMRKYPYDMYFSRALYKSAGSRSNVAFKASRTLALDLDVRPGKSKNYQTRNEALRAVTDFVLKANLPRPTIISSGGGLHVYWTNPFEMHEFSEIKLLAGALVRLAQQHNLLADFACTNNQVGVLRLPDTRNMKYADAMVQELVAGKPDPDRLYAALKPYMQGVPSAGMFAGMQQSPKLSAYKITFDSYDETPPKLSAIIQGCRQMVVAAGASEPIWRAGLTIARLCKGGDSTAIKWSDAGKYKTTARAMSKLKELAFQHAVTPMPATCAHFDSINPGVCGGCPKRGLIKSPIVLGRMQVVAPVPAPEKETPAVEQAQCVSAENQGQEDDTPPDIKTPNIQTAIVTHAKYDTNPRFVRDRFGIHHVVKDESDDADGSGRKKVLMFSGDLRVIARASAGQGNDSKIAFTWLISPPNAKPKEITFVPSNDNNALVNQLAATGLINQTMGGGTPHLADFMRSEMANASNTTYAHDEIDGAGWTAKKDGFAVGDTMFFTNHQAPAKMTVKTGAKDTLDHMHAEGSMEEWRKGLDVFAQPGMEAAQFVILSSFAAPLLRFTEVPGFTIHLASQGSGCGKTTIQKAAASIWGDPGKLLMSKEDTYNARIQKLGAFRNLPAFMDEITGMDSKKISDLVYSIAQGSEKARIVGSSHKVQQGVSWQTLVFTSANDSLRARIGAIKSYAEAENMRMFELQLPGLDPAKHVRDGATIKKTTYNYGHAGPIFAQWLVQNRDLVDAMVNERLLKLSDRYVSRSAERFWFNVLACIEVAGELAAAAGLHSFDMDKMKYWIGQSFLPAQRAATNNQLATGSGLLGDFLNDHQTATIVVRSQERAEGMEEASFMQRRPTSAKIAVRREITLNHTVISIDAVKQWCEKKFISPAHFMGELRSAGVVVLRERVQRDLGSGIAEYEQGGQGAWCLVLDMSTQQGQRS